MARPQAQQRVGKSVRRLRATTQWYLTQMLHVCAARRRRRKQTREGRRDHVGVRRTALQPRGRAASLTLFGALTCHEDPIKAVRGCLAGRWPLLHSRVATRGEKNESCQQSAVYTQTYSDKECRVPSQLRAVPSRVPRPAVRAPARPVRPRTRVTRVRSRLIPNFLGSSPGRGAHRAVAPATGPAAGPPRGLTPIAVCTEIGSQRQKYRIHTLT